MLRDILEIVTVLIGKGAWPKIRHDYISDVPTQWEDSYNSIAHSLMAEWRRLLGLLDPDDCQRLGLKKKARKFICLQCHSGKVRPDPPVLRPNTPTSTTIYCLVCDLESNVRRAQCPHCRGNVLDAEDGTSCLTCEGDAG